MQLTPNQQYVLAELQQASSPLSAYALLERLRKPGFNAPAQVYRALQRLVGRGLVHRLETLNAFVACSHPEDCHHPLVGFAICDSCGKADEFAVEDVGLKQWVENQAFVLDSSVFEIRGRCACCAKKMPTGSG